MNHLGILLLVGAAYAGPVRQDNIQGGEICATSCAVLPDSKYNYEVGKSYVYNYEAETETAIHGVGNDATGLWFTAVVTIKVLQPCDMVLSLENVEFYSKVNGERVSSDASRQFKVAAEAWPLYFAFANGHVEHVCPETDDPRWIVNIKKGILSAIQNTMPNLDNRHSTLETDVNGICPTEYTLKSGGWANWGQSVITKVKDLSNCRERHSTRTALKTIPFHTDETQSMPLVSSTHECEQNIFRGSYINSIVCRERHTFRPFSRGDSGATTATSQQLVFVREKRSISQTARGRRANKQPLTFVHEDIADGNDDDERNAARATRALADLCSLTQEDMRPEAPQKFSQLVYTMRQLSRGALSSLYVQIQSESVCAENKYRGRKFFLDALPLCATSGAIGVMVDIMEAGDLSTAENDAWLVGMALNTQTTTEQMLTEGKRLLEWTPPPRRGFLTVGTMVHNFCKDKPDCAEVPIVREIISMLEANLRYRCRPGGEEGDEKKILMSLKALGNAGVLIGSYDNLRACITDGESLIEMRLAAIDAMHRLPCDNDRYNRQPLLRVYEQISAPDEVRIAAYLGAMHCATNDVIDNVVEMLLNEPMNQVGSFVWTHLTNIAESSSPLKQEVRKHLLHSDLKQRFSSDARKFSRAYEGSFFSPLLQSGASVEAHTIFSRDSFLPRSGMLNISVDVFGSSLNLFELGGRVEGLDRTIASMFQPGGYFSDIADPVSSGEIADRRMSRLHQAYDARMVDTTSGSFYYKIMGNEIDFFDLESLKELGKINTISMMIELAKEHSYDASMSSMFLDTEMRVPTGTGVPIHLTLNGTFTVDLSLRGKLDLRQIFISPRSFNIDGHIKPSGAVEIAGLMVTDATVARTGVRTVATLHSSTAIEGRVQLQDGEVFNVDLKMPRDKLEILDVSSKIYSVHQEGEVEVVGVVEGRTDETLCTGDRLARFLGMQLCAEVAFPNATLQEAAPWYPFTGPSRVAITLEKTDKTFTDYQFEARWQKQKVRKDGKTYNTFTGRLSMDTPGSSIDREWTTDLVVNQADLAFSANLRSPYKKLGLEGSAINEPALKRGSVTLTVDRNTQYVLTGQFQSEKIGDFVRFSPFLVFEAPNRPQVTLQGKLDYTREAKLDVDLSITELTATPITLRGQVEKSGNSKNRQLNIDMTFASPIAEFEVAGNVKQFKQNYQTRFQVSHRLGASGRKETTTIAYKLRDTSTDEQLEYTETGSFKSTAWPDYDVHAYEFTLTKSKTRRYWNTMMYVKYGIQERELTLRHMFDDASNATDLIYATLASVTIPHRSIYWSLNANHAHGDKYLNTAVDVGYARNKKLAGRLTLTSERAPSRLNGQLQFTYPGREITSQATIEKVRPGLFDLTWTTAWDIGRQVVVTSQLERFPGETYDGESVLVTVGLPDRDPISVRVQKKWVHASNQNSWEFVLRPNSNDEYMMKAVLERPSKSEKIIQVSATRPGHSTVTTLKMKDGPKKVTEVDIRWDELHVTVVAGMQDYSIVSGQYLRTFSLDVAPDAGHRPEEKLSVSGNVTYPCALNTLCIPRKVEATARWARDQVIYTVITQDIVAWNDMQFSARVETPFNPLRMATFTQVVRTDVPGTILTSVEYNSYNQQMAHRSEIALASDRTALDFSSVQNGNEYANVGLTAYFRGSVRLEGTMAVSTPQTRHSADGSFELRNGSPTLEFTYNKDRHEYVYAKTSMSWPDSGMTLYRYRGDVVFDASFTGSGSYDLERVASSMDVRVNAPLYVDDLRVVYEASLANRRGFLLSGNVRMAGRETCRFNSDITGIRSGEFSYVHLGEPILAFRWTGNDETSPSIQFRRAVDFTMSAPYDYGVRFDVSKVMTDSLKLDVEFAVSTYGTELASVTATLGPTPFTGLIVTNYKGQQTLRLLWERSVSRYGNDGTVSHRVQMHMSGYHPIDSSYVYSKEGDSRIFTVTYLHDNNEMFYSKAGFSGVEAYRPRAEFLMRCKNKQIVNFLAEGSAMDGEKRASVSLESWFAEPITMGYIFASRSDYYGAAPFNLTDTFIKVGEKCLLGIEANGDASQSRNTYSKSLHYTVTSDYFQTYKVDYDVDYEDGRVNIREYSAKYGSKLLYSLSGTGYVEGYNNGYPANEYIGHSDFNLESYYLPSDVPSVGIQTSTNLTSTMRGMSIGLKKGQTQVVLAGWKYYFRTEPTNGKKLELSLVTPDMPLTVLLVESSKSDDQAKLNVELQKAAEKVYEAEISYDYQYSRGKQIYEYIVISKCPYHKLNLEAKSEVQDRDNWNHQLLYRWGDHPSKKFGFVVRSSLEGRSPLTMITTAGMVLPSRAYEVTVRDEYSSRHFERALEVDWDAKRDIVTSTTPSSRVSGSPSRASLMARHEREKLSEGEEAYHTIITLQHPFMDEDVVLSNDMTVGAWSSPVPLLSVTSLSYAPGADDNVTVQLHVRNDDDGYGSSNVSAAWSVTHPATNLALRFYGFRFSDGKRIEAEGCAEYQEANGELQRISVKGQHSMERTTVEVATPVLLWKGEAALRYTMDGSRYSAALSSQLNDRPPATVDAEVQATRPFSANAKVTWDATRPDEYSELWAGYLNETALKVHIVDLNARHDGPETYLLAEAMLNTSHILHLHTYTKPDIEYPDYVSNGPTYANIVTRVVGDYVEQEAAERYHLMRSEIHSLKSKYNQIKRKSNRIVAKMGSDVDMVMREHKLDVFAPLDRVEQLQDWSRRMVQSASEKVGEFYEGEAYREWQDQRRQQQERMSEAYSSAVQRATIAREDLCDATRQRINDWYDRYYTYKAEATDWIAPYKEEVDRYYYELYYKVEEYLSAIAERIAPLYDYIPVREIQECVRSCLQRIKQKIMSIYETMERHRQTNTAAGTDKVSAMREQLMNSWDAAAEHEYVQAAQGHLGKMSTMYDDLDTGVVTRRWDDVKNTYNGMQYRVNDVYNGMQDTYNDYKYRAKDQAQRTYDAMMKNEDAQYVRDVAQKAYGKGQWMYRYAEVDKLGSRALARLIALVKDYRNTVRIVVTPTPPNEFMADLYLQQDWHSFYELPYDAQYGDEQSLSRAIKYVRDLRLSDIQHGMWNQYYAYAPPSYDFIPPFEGSAMMAGSQHFFTFDSHAYDFASGGCSYVLAHDFVDGTFSIIVNYIRGDNDAITRTITVISNGMKIELAPAFQVMLGQNTVDLPIQFDNTTIVRRGDNVIVHNLHGVTVTCDWLRDVCRVNVSGWYFGKMAGLLGTYNNEAYDEFTDLRHNIKDYDEVMSFASSWNYGPCKNGMDRAYSYEVEASDADTFCSAIFQDKQSNFRRCFGQVDPEPFFRMCYNDARHSDHAPSAPPPSCTAAKAYVDECRDRGVRLSMPTTCVICETDRTRHFKNDVYEIGEDSTQDIDIQQYADVVFIVEEKQCNKIAVRSLVDLAKDLDTSLQENGLTSNRYALVGYGGYGVHDAPHVHTSKSRVFTAEPLSLAFDRLVIDGSEGTNDTMRAVEFATELPFRSGVSKTIVLITCSGCESEYMTMDYTKLQRQLLENGFKLHIMSDYNLRFKGAKRSSKNRQLLGIDGKSVCTLKDVRDVELECEESLYRQVVMPKDICVALAHETNGSMFSLNRFTNSALQKKFINVFSRRIAKTASPSPCQVCVCAENEDGAAVARCRPCEMPKPLSFVMMFPEEYTYDDDDDDTSNESNVPKTRTRKTRKNKKNRKSKRRNSFFFF